MINYSDYKGGAARAAFRLHDKLALQDVESQIYVQQQQTMDRNVVSARSKFDKLMALIRPEMEGLTTRIFSGGVTGPFSSFFSFFSNMNSTITSINPDIVHLHWVSGGMVGGNEFRKIEKPIVWTLHDMWPFTGGCHYSGECKNYSISCGNCVFLNRSGNNDLSKRGYVKKEKAYQNKNIVIVSPSRWLADIARKSSLCSGMKVVVIPNGIDLKKYKAHKKDIARDILGLSNEKRLILFGSMSSTTDPRKGFDLLYESLNVLVKRKDMQFECLVFGGSEPDEFKDTGLPITYLGNLYDDISLNILYSAADVMVVPSREENLANTVVESLASGTPVASFDIGGMSDMVEHKINGYLAKPLDAYDLAAGIGWCIEDSDRNCLLSRQARNKAEKDFNIEEVSRKYKELYESMLD